MRVFVDEQPITAPEDAIVRDAVAVYDPALAEALDRRTAHVTDGVGRPIAPDQRLQPGAILRVIQSRPRTGPGEV
ncbi:MAG: hypothetical protein PVF27_03220 [Gemmatimonadales bacterium]|jgi:hypothetical protein